MGIRRVSSGIDIETKPGQPFTYPRADRRLVFPDASREDDRVEPAERRRKPGDFSGDAEVEKIDRLARCSSVACQQFAAVGADPGRAEEA